MRCMIAPAGSRFNPQIHETSVTNGIRSTPFRVTPINVSRWRGRGVSRPGSRGFTITPNTLIDHARDLSDGHKQTHLLLISLADNATGMFTMSHAEIAERRGKGKKTIERHLKALDENRYIQTIRHYDYVLACWGPSTYRIVPPSERLNSTGIVDTKTTFDPRGGVKNVPLSNTNTLNSTTEKQEQIHPPVGGAVCVDIPARSPEPQRPEPSPEVHASEQLGRELRRQRHSEHREAHYREVREQGPRRRCSAPAPKTPAQMAAQVAAGEIMRLCGVAETSHQIRAAIAAALELHVSQEGKTARGWVEDAVMSWRTYLEDDLLRFRYGIERFFSEGLWCNERLWTYDRERLERYRGRY
jgi:hypothetical protein